MLGTLKKHVNFDLLNGSATAFVVTAVDVSSGELVRFRNRPHKTEPKTEIGPRHMLASGSLPPAFPATPVDGASFWDGGIVDNTPLGDAIDAFSGSKDADRFLIVMNLFRKNRAPPKNMIEVNDRLEELRYGNRVRQDRENARTINELLQTISELAAAVPRWIARSAARGACDTMRSGLLMVSEAAELAARRHNGMARKGRRQRALYQSSCRGRELAGARDRWH